MLSVNAYHKDLSISSQCVKLTNQELKEELCTEFPALDHDAMMLAMTELLRELFYWRVAQKQCILRCGYHV